MGGGKGKARLLVERGLAPSSAQGLANGLFGPVLDPDSPTLLIKAAKTLAIIVFSNGGGRLDFW